MYLTVQEVAERLRISPSSVYLLVESGQLAHHRIGARRGAIRIGEDDIAIYLAECRSQPKAPPAHKPYRPRLRHIKL